MGIKKQIFEKLATELSTLPWVTTVNWERIRIAETDIEEHEVPMIQIYDRGALNNHERGLLNRSMSVTIEVILKQTELGAVDQGVLFDRVEEVENLIGQHINLDGEIAGFLHMKYASDQTDLHTINPFYYAALNFEVLYKTPFSTC